MSNTWPTPVASASRKRTGNVCAVESVERLSSRVRRPAGLRVFSDVPVDIGRQHADNRVLHRVEDHCAPDHVRIAAEPALPQTIADDDHVILSRLAVFRREGAAEPGIYAPHGK